MQAMSHPRSEKTAGGRSPSWLRATCSLLTSAHLWPALGAAERTARSQRKPRGREFQILAVKATEMYKTVSTGGEGQAPSVGQRSRAAAWTLF